MTPRQQAMYWAEWSKLRDVLRAKGKTAGEIEAHRYNVTLRAIGAAKSSKLLSNGELDRVIARIKAETRARYIAGVAKKLCGQWPEVCTEADLAKVAGVLEARVQQLARAMSDHLAKVGAAASAPATPARAASSAPGQLVPGEDF